MSYLEVHGYRPLSHNQGTVGSIVGTLEVKVVVREVMNWLLLATTQVGIDSTLGALARVLLVVSTCKCRQGRDLNFQQHGPYHAMAYLEALSTLAFDVPPNSEIPGRPQDTGDPAAFKQDRKHPL